MRSWGNLWLHRTVSTTEDLVTFYKLSVSSLHIKISYSSGCSFIFSIQIWVCYQGHHLRFCNKANAQWPKCGTGASVSRVIKWQRHTCLHPVVTVIYLRFAPRRLLTFSWSSSKPLRPAQPPSAPPGTPSRVKGSEAASCRPEKLPSTSNSACSDRNWKGNWVRNLRWNAGMNHLGSRPNSVDCRLQNLSTF